MRCRHCSQPLEHVFVDLGVAPPSNAFVKLSKVGEPERRYPLRVLVCEFCWLVQTQDYVGPNELFAEDYAYFSSYSDTWLEHCRRFVDEVIKRFGLDAGKMVVEIAANDGCLLEYVKQRGIPCCGVEPTKSTAAAARSKGIRIVEEFFGSALAERMAGENQAADLLVANNVLAHVPQINDFLTGIARLLKPHGVATFEFAHLLKLVQEAQFDTIYHEHYSYLSLLAAEAVMIKNGLQVFDVEEVSTHGGSLRVFAQRSDQGCHARSVRVDDLLARERAHGMGTLAFYQNFQVRVDRIKDDLLNFLFNARRNGNKVVAYGAAAKGTALLNYAGVGRDLLAYVVDRNPHKQGMRLPGSHIPVVEEARLSTDRPDYIVILPWNLTSEIVRQLFYVRAWGGKFVRAIPKLEILER